MALDLSGPFASAGMEARAGFELAIKDLRGALGGVPAEFIQFDTGGNPELARVAVARMIRVDKIDLFTGPMGSNVALAVGPMLFAAKVPYLSSHPGPSPFAGARCHPFFFSVGSQDDSTHESAGRFASEKKFGRVVLVASDDPAGKDALGAFKRFFKTPVVDEIYARPGQVDHRATLARIREARPDAIYFALPGAPGLGFVQQAAGAGFPPRVAMITTAASADQDAIAAVGEPMLGVINIGAWSHDLNNPTNRAFVAEYREAYHRYPNFSAQQAYDTVMAMDAAVRQVGAKTDDHEALARALATANFRSVRGPFRYGANHYPVQDYHVRVVSRDALGSITNRTIGAVSTAHQDAYVSQCAMKEY